MGQCPRARFGAQISNRRELSRATPHAMDASTTTAAATTPSRCALGVHVVPCVEPSDATARADGSRDAFGDVVAPGARAMTRAMTSLRRSRAADSCEYMDASTSYETYCAFVLERAMEAFVHGRDSAVFALSGTRGAAAETTARARVVERAIARIEERVDGLPRGSFELSATCVGVGLEDKAQAKDLLDGLTTARDDGARRADGTRDGGDASERGVTVVHIENARDGTLAFESAMKRAAMVFAEGVSKRAGARDVADHHAIFSLRLKLRANDDDDDDDGGEAQGETITRLHFVMLAPYVPAPGLFGGQENRTARVRCTRSMTALMAVLRDVGAGGEDAFRRIKTWRDSPLTKLMWGCGMADLKCATLMVLIEHKLRYSVDGDETSDLTLSPEAEGALKFAMQVKEHAEEADGIGAHEPPAPRTHEPPAPTPTKRAALTPSATTGGNLKTLRAEAPAAAKKSANEHRAPHPQRVESDIVRGTKISPEHIDAIIRVIRTHVHGLNGRRMESTIRNLATEWTQMARAHESIIDEFAALETQLTNAQTREDEAVQYAEQVAADLAVASRWCETLEAEQATMSERIERAARDAAAAAEARADAIERRAQALELQLVRNSVPEMERVRDEAEEAAKQAMEKYRAEQDAHAKTREALGGETSAKRALIEQVEFLQARLEESDSARASDRAEIDRTREELRARFAAEGTLRDELTSMQREHETELKRARDAAQKLEDTLARVTRERDDARHRVQRGEEDLIESRANAQASLLNVESLQAAANEAKAAQSETQRQLERIKLENSDLLVQVKHATRELEETSTALNKLQDKLDELETESEDSARKRRAADDEAHDLRQVITDLELRIKSMDMDREIAYQAADVARVENAKLTAEVMDLTDDVSRLKSSLEQSRAATRALLDEEASRLARLAPPAALEEYTTPSWLSDTSWQTLAPAS